MRHLSVRNSTKGGNCLPLQCTYRSQARVARARPVSLRGQRERSGGRDCALDPRRARPAGIHRVRRRARAKGRLLANARRARS